MCVFCGGEILRPYAASIPDRVARATHATLLHANALVCLALALESTVCRTCSRRHFEKLVTVTRSFVAEFKVASINSEHELTVPLQHTALFCELLRRARGLLGRVRDTDPRDDVLWAIESGRYLATALINLAVVAETRADFEQALSGLTDLAGLVTDLGEAQSEVTGEAPPEWDPECPAYRADRLAVYLYDAVEQLDIKRRKARTQSG